MDSKQKAAIKYNIKQKYLKGKITLDEYNDLVDQLQILATAGASLQDANQALGLAKKEKQTMTMNDLQDISTKIAQKFSKGEISLDEYDDLNHKLNDLYFGANNKSPSAVKKMLGLTGAKPAAAQPAASSAGMTPEEYKKQKSIMFKKVQAGEMTNYAYIQWKKKNDPSKNPTGASSASAAPAGMTEEQKNEILDYINDLATNGDIEYDDSDELVSMINDLQQNGIDAKAAKDAAHNAAQMIKLNGMTGMEAAMIAHADVLAKAQNIPQPTPVVANNAGANAATQAEDKLAKELKKVYKQATDEMIQQLAEFTTKYGDQLAEKQAKVAAGEMTQAELQAWINGKEKIIELMNAKIDQMTDTLFDANQKAAAMVNGETYGVFAENANYQSYQISQQAKLNLSFAVYDEESVRRLIMDKPELLPRKIVNGKKDKAWNQKKIAAAVAQGILQGQSIPQLAKRIATDTGYSNMDAMIRYARTAITGAQNGGRMEALHRAKDLGVKVKKQWLATLDSRTRDSHQKLDGETVDVDAKFSNGLMFPGDMNGPQGEVWNCRCTMVYEYEGFESDPVADQRIQYDDYYTTYKDKDGKKHQVYHRAGDSLITNMNYGEWKAAKQSSKLNDLNFAKVTLAELQKEFIKKKVDETKVYSDLWKDPVTLADYPAKAAGIAAKRDYYTAEIDKLNNAIANGESWAKPEKVKELEKKRKLLNEFELNGQILANRNEALKMVQDLYDQIGLQKQAAAPTIAQPKAKKATKTAAGTAAKASGTSGGTAGQTAPVAQTAAQKGQFAADAWDAKTKKAARDFARRTEADKVLRPELDAMWDTLTDEEKYGVWLYTWNSNPMNKPLSGHHDSWNRSSGYVGYDKAEWSHEDDYSNRNISGCGEMGRFARRDGHAEYKKGIVYTTNAIEKAQLQEGQWLVRGSDENGLAGWFAGAGMKFDSVTKLFSGGYSEQQMKQALVGKKAMNHAFTSTAISRDAGFSGNVKYRIYAPKGTKGIYAEPQSHYGNTTGGYMGSPVRKARQDKIYKKGESYPSVGGEAEIILQRGTTYVCTGLKVTGYDWRGNPEIEIEMEVVEQPDYFKYGDEDTYNGGKTRHKK